MKIEGTQNWHVLKIIHQARGNMFVYQSNINTNLSFICSEISSRVQYTQSEGSEINNKIESN